MNDFQKAKEKRRTDRAARAKRRRQLRAGEVKVPDQTEMTYEVTNRGRVFHAHRPARVGGRWMNRETRRLISKK